MIVTWVTDIQTSVYSQVKRAIQNKKTKLADTHFSTVGSSDTPAVFPFVYIHQISAVEQGRDLSGTSINAGLFTFQIEVTSNDYQSTAMEVMKIAITKMKEMGFEMVSFPVFEDTQGLHRCIARFRRLIGEGDKFVTVS